MRVTAPLKGSGAVIFLLLCANAIFAQSGIRFEASVNQPKIGINDFVEVSFNLSNANDDSFTPPPFNDFRITGGPNQSTQFAINNGSVSRSKTYSFFLSPRKVGSLTIGAATVTVGSKTFTTKPITIEVVKEAAGSGNALAHNARPGTAPQVPKASKNPTISDKKLADGIYLHAVPSRSKAYIGEQITVDFKLYTRFDLSGKQFLQLPELKGFFPVEFKQFDSNTRREKINGTTYAVQTLRKLALFPQRAGTLTIDPMLIQVGVILDAGGADPLDPFSVLANVPLARPYELKSGIVNIQIKDLPANKPKNFTGAVGSFSMTVKSSPNALTTDDAVRVEMSVVGNGDFKRVQPPTLGIADSTSFEIYEPKITDAAEETPSDVQGQRKFEWVLLPHKIGTLTLAPTFSYFNTTTKTYENLSLPTPITVAVTAGKKPIVPLTRKDSTTASRAATGAMRPDKTNFTAATSHTPFFGSALFWLLSLMPFIVNIVVFGYRRYRASAAVINAAFIRRDRASTVAQKRLQEAAYFLHQKANRLFYDAISKAIYGYLTDKFELPTAALSHQYLQMTLPQKRVAPDEIAALIRLLNTCEMAIFAGAIDSATAAQRTYDEAVAFIDSCERVVNNE